MTDVAILLATYNGEKYLLELVESIMRQTYQEFVCYIHDDGSSDHTMDIIKKIRDQYSDKIILLNYPATGSSKANFMSMLSYVKEPYIMFADQDDVWIEDKVEISLNTIKNIEGEKKKPCLVFTDLKIVDSELRTLDKSFMKKMGFNPKRIKYQQLMTENIAAGCTMIINKSLMKLVNRLENNQNIRMHDGWFMVVAAVYGKIEYISKQTILYRQHESNVFGSKKRTFGSRIKSNINLFLNGENKTAKKKWLEQIDNMARELLEFEDLPNSVRITLNELLMIHKKSKLRRIQFYVKNDFMRNKQNLWMLLWV